jgi:hypothetical protein
VRSPATADAQGQGHHTKRGMDIHIKVSNRADQSGSLLLRVVGHRTPLPAVVGTGCGGGGVCSSTPTLQHPCCSPWWCKAAQHSLGWSKERLQGSPRAAAPSQQHSALRPHGKLGR